MKASVFVAVVLLGLVGATTAQNNPALAGDEYYTECRYFVVTVTNWSPHELTFIGSSTSSGKIEATPPSGVKIARGEHSRHVFIQSHFPTYQSVSAKLEFTGKKGHFFLYAKQDFCFVSAGDVSCNGEYKGTGEGTTFCDGTKGGFNQANGKASFAIQENINNTIIYSQP